MVKHVAKLTLFREGRPALSTEKKKNTEGNYIQHAGGKCFSLKYIIYTISAVFWWTSRAGSDNLMNTWLVRY